MQILYQMLAGAGDDTACRRHWLYLNLQLLTLYPPPRTTVRTRAMTVFPILPGLTR